MFRRVASSAMVMSSEKAWLQQSVRMQASARGGNGQRKAAPESLFSPRRLGMLAGLFVFPVSAGTILYLQERYTEPPVEDGATKLNAVLQNRRNAGTFMTGGGDEKDEVVISDLKPATKASLGGPFELYDCKTGKLVSDSDVFKGHWTLLYFGFTRCAEICPNCTKFMSEVITTSQEKYGNKSKEDEETRADASKMQICFVSVDHIRDRPGDLTKFMNKWAVRPNVTGDNTAESKKGGSSSSPWWKFWSRGGNSSDTVPYVGLVGKTKEEVTAAASAWRVYISSVEETDEERLAREAKGIPAPDLLDDSYQVDHSAAIYFIGPDGQMKDFFFREIGVEQTVDRIGLHFADVYGIKNL